MTYEIKKLNAANTGVDAKARRIGILALAVGSFAIGTAEFVAMGLQPEMAQSSGVDIPTAGQYISAYALGVVVGAPVLAVATAKFPRKYVLIALMIFYAFSNIASACVTSFDALVGLRFMSGLPHGIYFGVAAIAASSMVEMKQRPKAIGSVMLGLTIATVIGAPGATWIGQQVGWQIAFVLVGMIALFCALLIWRFLPTMPTAIGTSPLTELGALKQKQVWLLLAMVSIGSAGLFSVFTYIKSTLMHVSGVSLEWVPFIMPLLGLGMVAGNIFGPKIAVRIGAMRMIFLAMLWSSVTFFLFFFFSHAGITAAIGCFLVGTSFASMPSIQTRIMDVAGNAQTLAGALMQSAFNIANAIGAESGAKILKLGYSYEYTAVLGGVLTLCGLAIFSFSWYVEKRDQRKLS
ncbi:MFS transporter [Bartonella sp. LJL80]